MKRLLLVCVLFASGIATYAQQGCSKTLPLFRFDNGGTPKPVYKLGTSPEFPFLRNQKSPATFVAAVMKAERDPKYKKGINEFNSLLVEVGFENGIKDLKQSSVTEAQIAPGEAGKMGSGNFSYAYTRFAGTHDFKAWKLTSDKGCFMYVMAVCGNAFYPESAAKDVQPVAMLDTKEFTGNIINQPIEETKEMPKAEEEEDEPEDCYCKFRRMYKAYYPEHSKRENRYRRVYGPGDYPRYCSTGRCATSCGR